MVGLEDFARQLIPTEKPLRLMYGVATGPNTVQLDGSTTSVSLPAVSNVSSGEFVAVLAVGADRLILGSVS